MRQNLYWKLTSSYNYFVGSKWQKEKHSKKVETALGKGRFFVVVYFCGLSTFFVCVFFFVLFFPVVCMYIRILYFSLVLSERTCDEISMKSVLKWFVDYARGKLYHLSLSFSKFISVINDILNYAFHLLRMSEKPFRRKAQNRWNIV